MAKHARRIASLMLHTSPLEQAGIGDAGGMNVYVAESAKRIAASGVAVDIYTVPINRVCQSKLRLQMASQSAILKQGHMTELRKMNFPRKFVR